MNSHIVSIKTVLKSIGKAILWILAGFITIIALWFAYAFITHWINNMKPLDRFIVPEGFLGPVKIIIEVPGGIQPVYNRDTDTRDFLVDIEKGWILISSQRNEVRGFVAAVQRENGEIVDLTFQYNPVREKIKDEDLGMGRPYYATRGHGSGAITLSNGQNVTMVDIGIVFRKLRFEDEKYWNQTIRLKNKDSSNLIENEFRQLWERELIRTGKLGTK